MRAKRGCIPKQGISNNKDPITHVQAPRSSSMSFPKESKESSESWRVSGTDGGDGLDALSTSTIGFFPGSIGSTTEAIRKSFMARVASTKLVVCSRDSCHDAPQRSLMMAIFIQHRVRHCPCAGSTCLCVPNPNSGPRLTHSEVALRARVKI